LRGRTVEKSKPGKEVEDGCLPWEADVKGEGAKLKGLLRSTLDGEKVRQSMIKKRKVNWGAFYREEKKTVTMVTT